LQHIKTANGVPDAQKILNDALKKNPEGMDALLQRGNIPCSRKISRGGSRLEQRGSHEGGSPEVALMRWRNSTRPAARHRGNGGTHRDLRLNPLLLQARIELAGSLISDNAGQAALELLDAAPGDQRNLVTSRQQRNWALLALGKIQSSKENDQGLAALRTPTLLLQDAF